MRKLNSIELGWIAICVKMPSAKNGYDANARKLITCSMQCI